MMFAAKLRGIFLFLSSFLEILVPFVRTVILSHLLGSYEFGFASAIAVTSATFTQVTDFAISSFVISSPRGVYLEALAGAHALAILRGVCVAAIVVVASKPVACSFNVCGAWTSFSWLALVALISSFEHLGVRVEASRDYNYRPAFIAIAASNVIGLSVLLALTYELRDHYGLVAFLIVQSFVYVLITHFLGSSPYRVKWRSPFLGQAFWFGVPLLLNGVGLAVISQGDRWIVGSFLGLPFLGLYAVVTLAAFVPLIGVLKVIGPTVFAGLHHAPAEAYQARVKLYSRAVPAIAALYSIGVLALYDWVVPAVFGARYSISRAAVTMLAAIAFVRIVRTDPQTCLLFHAQKPHQLAVVSQAPFIGLFATAFLVLFHPTLVSVLSGTLVGEIAAFGAISYASRGLLRTAIYDHLASVVGMGLVVLLAATSFLLTGDEPSARIIVLVVFAGVIAIIAGLSLPWLYSEGYGRPYDKACRQDT